MKNGQIKVSLFDPKELESIIDNIDFLLDRAMKFVAGKYDKSDLITSIKNYEMQLWVVHDDDKIVSITITQVINYPRKRVLSVLISAGEELKYWINCRDILYAFARHQLCHAVEINGRPGWERILKGDEYQKVHVCLHKEL